MRSRFWTAFLSPRTRFSEPRGSVLGVRNWTAATLLGSTLGPMLGPVLGSTLGSILGPVLAQNINRFSTPRARFQRRPQPELQPNLWTSRRAAKRDAIDDVLHPQVAALSVKHGPCRLQCDTSLGHPRADVKACAGCPRTQCLRPLGAAQLRDSRRTHVSLST